MSGEKKQDWLKYVSGKLIEKYKWWESDCSLCQ